MGDYKIAASIMNDCKLGNSQVDKIYLGNELLWSKETYGTETISFVPTGNANGVAKLVVTSNGQQYIKITGGYFYNDINGNTGQSITKSLSNGINTIYFKCSTNCYINFGAITKINSYDASPIDAPCCVGLSFLSNLDYISIYGNNTIHNTGADSLSSYITFYNLHGSNTIDSIPVLPNSLITYILNGKNTVSNLYSYGSNIKIFELGGYNTIPSLPAFPSSLENLSLGGYNTISSIPSLPTGIKYITIGGYNTISSMPTISSTSLELIIIDGYNVITSIPTLPSTIKEIGIFGRNIVSFMPTLPSGITNVRIAGYNSITFNVAGIPNSVQHIELASQYGDYIYNTTPGKSWVGSVLTTMIISPKINSMTSAMVDSLLIDLNTKSWGIGYIYLAGNCAPRTSASNAAVSNIQSQGATVITN